MAELLSMSQEELVAWMVANGEAKFRASQVFSQLHRGLSPAEMTNLSKPLREKLLRELSDKNDRSAAFVCTIACVMPDGREFCVEGRAEGTILEAPSGENGFGYDPLFYYEPLDKSFADLTAEEKNRISHRACAVKAFAEALTKVL